MILQQTELNEAVSQGLGEAWENPDRTLLGDAMPGAPKLPLECFGSAAPYIEKAAHGTSAPVDYVAAMLLAAVSGLTGRSFEVRINKGWYEPLILWIAMVGPPSSGKTPACQPIRKRLFAMQKKMISDHDLKVDGMIADLNANGLAGLSGKELKEAMRRETERLEALRAHPPRCIVSDSTVEALADIEPDADRGMLIDRDELAGLITSLERYSSGVDRAFYLEAYQRGGYALQRIKYGSKFIENHCFSIAGGIQPDRLQSLLTHSGDDDGFMARLLVFWPDPLPPSPIPEGCLHHEMDRALERILRIKLPVDSHVLVMPPEGFEIFDAWYQKDRGGRVGTLGKVGSAYGKLPGYAVRIAAILHILDWAFGGQDDSPTTEIDERHVAAALVLVESYLVPQIKRTYHGADLSAEEMIIASILQQCRRLKLDHFNLRIARREWGIPGARGQGASKRFDNAATLGEKAGWIRRITRAAGSKDYEVNPALHSGARA